jgi:hypothetical protein
MGAVSQAVIRHILIAKTRVQGDEDFSSGTLDLLANQYPNSSTSVSKS